MRPWQKRHEILEREIIPLYHFIKPEFPNSSGNSIQKIIHDGKISVNSNVITDIWFKIRQGDIVVFTPNAPNIKKHDNLKLYIYYYDKYIVVCEKISGMLTVPYEDNRDAVSEHIRKTLSKIEKKQSNYPLGVVQRLDKEASGVVVFTRSLIAQRRLQEQFKRHTVNRSYIAYINGRPNFSQKTIRSFLIEDRGDGIRGSADCEIPGSKEAITHVKVIESYNNFTKIQCVLQTGRTHQIRIHLSELGYPIIGEQVYIRNYRNPINAPRLMLHAKTLGFTHPIDNSKMEFESAVPEEILDYVSKLSKK